MTRPTFTLRDLFWLVLAAGLALGWYRRHAYSEREIDRAYSMMRRNEHALKFVIANREASLAEVHSDLDRLRTEKAWIENELAHLKGKTEAP